MQRRFVTTGLRVAHAAGRRALARWRSSRRWPSLLAIALVACPVAWVAVAPAPSQARPAHPVALGFTFSQRQAEYLTLPWGEVYGAALDLSPTIIRLGAYWDEIEPVEGLYDWATLDEQIELADARNLDVILTVGMKAPRWPEYFLPGWLEQRLDLDDGATVSEDAEIRRRTLAFVERVVRRYRDHDAIAYWQVENEPLDPSGPRRWQIGPDFLAQEVALVREIDERPVIVTMFVEVSPMLLAPWREREVLTRAATLLSLGDVLGLDLYPSRSYQSHGGDWYFSWPAWVWKPTLVELQQLSQHMGRSAWIMEAQAEPWEPGKLVYTDAPLSRSVQPAGAAAAVWQLRDVGFDTILLWGVEHWYMRRERHQDALWWDQMLTFFPLASTGGPARASVEAPPA